MSVLGRTIRRLREEQDLTLRDLAKDVGVSSSFLSQVEQDKASPSLATLKSIATTVASQSVTGVGQFSNTAYTDQQIYQQVTAHFNSQDFLQQVGGTSSATPATAMNSAATATSTQGDAATLYNAFEWRSE